MEEHLPLPLSLSPSWVHRPLSSLSLLSLTHPSPRASSLARHRRPSSKAYDYRIVDHTVICHAADAAAGTTASTSSWHAAEEPTLKLQTHRLRRREENRLGSELGRNSIALPKLLPKILQSFETCLNFSFFNLFSITFDQKFGSILSKIFGNAIELTSSVLAADIIKPDNPRAAHWVSITSY